MNVVPTKQASKTGLWNVVKCLFSSEKPDASTLPTWFVNAALASSENVESEVTTWGKGSMGGAFDDQNNPCSPTYNHDLFSNQ